MSDYFEFEDIPASPEEPNMQKAKQSIIDEKAQEQENEKAQEDKKEQKEQLKEIKTYQSLFYPAVQGIQDYILKDADIPPATDEDKDQLKHATAELEIKYSANKINNEESRFIAAFLTPLAKNYSKFFDYAKAKLNTYRNKSAEGNNAKNVPKGAFNGADKSE